jgi:hypothetical protein
MTKLNRALQSLGLDKKAVAEAILLSARALSKSGGPDLCRGG